MSEALARALKDCVLDAPFTSDEGVRRVFGALDGGGEETRVVGGAVRNALIGEPVQDIDFATTATPEEIIRRAGAAKLKCVPTGIEHGTITVIAGGVPHEVTTLREDVETDGRRARVRFGRDFEHDARRRDFTMNALSATADGRIHDYTGGLADLAARRVRFIGEARQRIREDYLRLLRYYRFHAAYGEGAMDAEAFAATIAEREGLAGLSRERVRAELMKLLITRRAAEVAWALAGTGILQTLIGGVPRCARLESVCAIETARGDKADAVVRLAALAGFVVEDAERLREKLRLSNAEAARVERALAAAQKLHGRASAPEPRQSRVMLFEEGRSAALDGLTLAQADSGAAADDASWRSAARFLRDTPEPRLPFSGADLVRRGLPAGKGVGAMLKRLQASWIRAGFPSDATTLAQLIDEAMGASK